MAKSILSVRRRRGVAAVAASLFLVLSACTSGGDGEGEQQPTAKPEERVLTIRHCCDPETLQAAFSVDDSVQPGLLMSIALWTLDREGNPFPMLAESWEVSDDGLQYTFHLKDWTWSDGKPVTSEDVKYSIEEVLVPYNQWGSAFFSRVSTVDAPDPRTVIIHLEQPQDLALPLSHGFGTIIPKHVYEGTDIFENPANKDPVVAGPYILSEYVSGSHVTLARNPYWADDPPYFDRIVFRIIPDITATINALRTGEIDLLFQNQGIPPRDLAAFSQDPNFQVLKAFTPFGTQDTLLFNTLVPPLDNQLVRQAIATAIDRQAIVDAVELGTQEVATGHVSHLGVLSEFATEDFLSAYAYDPERARQLLDQAGFAPGPDGVRFTLKMTVPNEFPAPEQEDAIVGYLKEVGIEVKGEVADFNTHWARVFDWTEDNPWRGFNMAIMPSMYTAPVNVEAYYFSERYDPGTYWSNAWAYQNPLVDDQIQSALSAAGPEEVSLMTAIQEQLAEDLPTFPLTTRVLYTVGSADLENLPMGGGLIMYPPLPPYDVRRSG